MFTSTILSILLTSSLLWAEVAPPVSPKVEAVPSPEIQQSEALPGKTDGKVKGSANVDPNDMALIKTEKKNCHLVKGILKCPPNKKSKKKKQK